MFKRTILYLVLLCCVPLVDAQDALTSVKFNLSQVKLSSDAKNITFNIYVQSINKDTVVAIPGYVFCLNIPQADIGTSNKVISITNASKELGYTSESIVAKGTDWFIKFLNGIFISSYSTALVAPTSYPGSLIGTVGIRNADGSSFTDPVDVSLVFSGTGVISKSTCSVFKPNTTMLANNSSNPLHVENFSGLGKYTLYSSGNTTDINLPFSQYENGTKEIRVYDLYGRLVLSTSVRNLGEVNLSTIPAGIYVVEKNGIKEKFVRK